MLKPENKNRNPTGTFVVVASFISNDTETNISKNS